MLPTERTNMLVKSYLNQAELLLKNYVSADLFVVYTSIIIGIFACKTVCKHVHFGLTVLHHYFNRFVHLVFIDIQVYDLSQLISPVYFKSYPILTKALQIEWSNRWVDSPTDLK